MWKKLVFSQHFYITFLFRAHHKRVRRPKRRKQSHFIFSPRGKTYSNVQDPRVGTGICEMFFFAWVGGHWPSFSQADMKARWKRPHWSWCQSKPSDVRQCVQQEFITPFIYIYTFAWRRKGTKSCNDNSALRLDCECRREIIRKMCSCHRSVHRDS